MSNEYRSLIDVLRARAEATPTSLALIANDRGRWVPMSVRGLMDSVASIALGLVDDGLRPGDVVAIIGESRPEWLITDLAVQAAGGVSAAVPVSDDDDRLATDLSKLGAVVVVSRDALLGDQVAALVDAGRIAPVRRMLHFGFGPPEDSVLDGIAAAGAAVLAARPTAFDDLCRDVDPSAPATITFTGGAGGSARPVAHAAVAQFANARAGAGRFELGYQDVAVTSVPPSHPLERATTIYPALFAGCVLAFPEGEALIDRATIEVRPTVAHVSAERVRAAATSVQSRFRRNRGFKRLAYRWWRKSALLRGIDGKPPSRLAVRTVGAPALRSLGWENLRYLMVTGGEVPAGAVATMSALGLTILKGYATTEAGLVAVGSLDDDRWRALDDVTVVADDGRLTIRTDAACLGLADGTPFERSDDGAFDLGDLGVADGDWFEVHGPAGSVLELADGATVIAAQIERRLRDSPYIALAVVRPDGVGLHADIEIDADAVGDWAAERTLLFTTFSSLVELGAVEELVADEVARLAPEVGRHDLLASPLQQGRDITRTGRTLLWAHKRGDADQASTEHHESTAGVD